MDDAAAFWRGQIPAIAGDMRVLIVAEREGAVVGTVVLTLAPQPNAPHRAEIGKMLVDAGSRRLGIGRALLSAAEAEAVRRGRTLLTLDTQEGSSGEHLYRDCGWTAFGTMPDHSLTTAGLPAPTVFFYKRVGAP